MDTAAVLLAGWAGEVVLDDLRGAADAAARLAAAHRDTPMIARTLGQQALPTTFGLVAAGWCTGLDRARAGLARVLGALPVQFGGAAGTLAGLTRTAPRSPRRSPAAAAADAAPVAHRADPDRRARRRARRGGRGLRQAGHRRRRCSPGTELGEVSEAAPGDSSSMPHKRNPIAAVTARAAARRAPGLAAVLLGRWTASTSARPGRGTPSGRPSATCCAPPAARRTAADQPRGAGRAPGADGGAAAGPIPTPGMPPTLRTGCWRRGPAMTPPGDDHPLLRRLLGGRRRRS